MTELTPPPYPPEVLDDDDDDGTMPNNVAELAEHVVGRRIVRAEKRDDIPSDWRGARGFVLTLDDGRRVVMRDNSDCCAYTALDGFLAHPELVDHAITGVGTTDGYTRWHIYAAMGDVLELEVAWSSGNPFYYAYGFDIEVLDLPEVEARIVERKAIGAASDSPW